MGGGSDLVKSSTTGYGTYDQWSAGRFSDVTNDLRLGFPEERRNDVKRITDDSTKKCLQSVYCLRVRRSSCACVNEFLTPQEIEGRETVLEDGELFCANGARNCCGRR